ncbi:MAG: hypothetical protein V7L00_16250 [Nostoc sp.]|uniref:hypothetical protein n=1 Tax=Nostoc sp. TaxID=1180 RepID=UPI002FF525D7
MNDSETIFTDLTLNEEASLSGGKKSHKTEKRKTKKPQNLAKKINIYSNGDIIGSNGNIIGVSYGAVGGIDVLGNSGNVTGGSGVVILD